MTDRHQCTRNPCTTQLTRLGLCLLLLAFPGAGFPQAQDLEAVLGRIISAYGGEENLRKLDSHIKEWNIVALMGNRHGTDVRAVRVPNQLKVELMYPHKKEIRIVDGEVGHVIFGDEPAQVASRLQGDAMRLQLMRLYSPLVLYEHLDSLSLTTDETNFLITLSDNGLTVDYVVNKDNWRIEKVVGTLTIDGKEMKFLTEYSHFSFYDGVLVHTRENKYAGGVNTAVLQLRRIVLDAKLDDSDFGPGGQGTDDPKPDENTVI